MASNYTPNLNLCQWAEEDAVLREDFNADNAKIDAALATKCEVYTGTYNGNGKTSQTITLGFKPKFVWVWQANSATPFSNTHDVNSAIAFPGYPALHYNDSTALEITNTGFTAYCRPNLGNNFDIFLNTDDTLYAYLVLK